MAPLTFAALVSVWVVMVDPPASQLTRTAMIVFWVAVCVTVVQIPLGIIIRGQVFKKQTQGEIVTPEGYASGNIIAWSCCEGAAFFFLITALIGRALVPYALPAAVPILVMILLWPNGRAMFPPAQRNPYRGEH